MQRRRKELRVGTVASPGACREGDMELQCRVMGRLQRGCIAEVRLPTENGGSNLHEVMGRHAT